uniref:Rho-GAP domain-containing protein n=1 Tax=Chrysolophus pictus TaxID=9089 RepID=A0A8C3LGA8_CHRPC
MAEQRRGLLRLAVLQELRVSYGIKVKSGACLAAAKQPAAAAAESKVFGTSFYALPQSLVPEYGYIPSFLVDACEYLEEHVHTEGLFRKSGSLVRLKALKSKLDQGENCLSAALPCDVAGLLKQFFRELPEPILPPHLQDGLLKAQQLANRKKAATMLLSCLMADRTIEALRYFFNFLRTVSLRSNENRMDSGNLAVIFAPNLLHSNENEKLSTSTEKKIRLQAAVVQTFIDHAEEIGRVPEFILEKIPAMLGVDAFQSTPSLRGYEESENESPSECKRRRHRSVGVLSSVTPVVLTPSTKRKLPADCSQGLSSKKRRSFKHGFGFELLPSSIFNSNCTPASVQLEASPCVSLESLQASLSPSTCGENHLSSTGNRRSKRLASKKLYRAESGKTGCFSPKISRKEMVRRSLRLKFGLGKSSRDVNVASGCAVGNRAENIGRRLASQQNWESGAECAKRGVLFSPCVNEKVSKKGSKNVSKSEENLLTPKCHNKVVYRMSWNSPTVTDSQEISSNEGILTGNSSSESAFVFEKLPVLPDEYRLAAEDQQDSKLKLCEEANNLTAETLLKVKQAFSGSGSNLHHLRADTKSSFSGVTDETLKETLCLPGLSPEKELVAGVSHSPAKVDSGKLFHQQCQSCGIDKQQPKKDEMKSLEKKSFRTSLEIELQVQKPDIRNVIELPVPQVLAREQPEAVQNSSSKDDLKLDSSGREEELELLHSQTAENGTVKCCSSEEGTVELPGAGQLPALQLPVPGNEVGNKCVQAENSAKTKASTVPDHGKVSDHIQWFNRLSLNDPSSASKTKPPLKFQRTPVRQSVRRINSLLEANKRSISSQLNIVNDIGSPLVKSLSCDSALSSCTEKPNKNSSALSLKSESTFDQVSTSHSQLDLTSKPHCRHLYLLNKPDSVRTAGIYRQKVTVHSSKSVLEDLTNQETVKSCLKVNTDMNIPDFAPEKSTITRSAPGKEKARYRGSPKNPISKVKLLPTAKPVDL